MPVASRKGKIQRQSLFSYGQGCSAVGIKRRVSGQDHASEALPQIASVEDKYESALAEDASDFVAGAGDSLSFGLTALLRHILPGGEQANPCSQAYGYGETAETVSEIGLMGLSSGLKYLARNVTGNAARRGAARMGASGHHVNPLMGHPVNLTGGKSVGTVFPTRGLPASIHSSGWNLNRALAGQKSAHDAAHLRLLALESTAMAAVNPGATAVRAARNVGCAPF